MIWLLKTQLYWRVRSFRRRIMLWLTWRRVRLTRNAGDRWNQIGILRQIAQQGLPGLLIGGMVVGLVQVVSNAIAQVPSSAPAFGLVEHLRGSPGTAYDSLLTTVPTVAGVLLGLYYGALATLIGSRYGRVPGEIRSLVAGEPAGTTYAGLLALAMGVSLFLLGLEASGGTATRLHTYALLAVSFVALYGFSALGRRVFDFLDPTRLVRPVVPDFLTAAQQATTRGYRYDTEEYQALYQRQAAYQLDLLEILFALARPEERHGSRRLIELAQYVPLLLREYLALKPAIPAASRWYPRIAKQRRWYMTDSAYLEVALTTRTSLPYEEAVDTNWVEERLLSVVENQIVETVSRSDWELLSSLLDVLRSCNRAMGQAWSTALAEETTGRVEAAILPRLPVTSVPKDVAFQVALGVDLLAMSRLDWLLGFRERVSEVVQVDFADAVGRIDWKERHSIYSFPASFAVSDLLETFRTQLGFERDVHGRQVTPAWYLAEELARQLQTALKTSIEPLLQQAERGLPAVPGEANNVERAQVLGAFASRNSEYANKLGHMSELANELVAKLRALDRSHDLKWADWDAASFLARIRSAADARALEFAKLIPALALVPPGPERVDHFGEAVSVTAEECLRALEEDNDARFQALFPLYFYGCLTAAEQIRREAADWAPEAFATIYTEALVDLMAISGYALVYAELRRKHAAWILVKKLWSTYLGEAEGAARANVFETAYSYHKGLLAITPRSILRTGWHMRMDQSLRAIPRKEVIRGQFAVHEWPDHPSPLIRALNPGDLGSHYDGQDVFVSCFLRRGKTRPDSDHLHDSIEFARKNVGEDE